MTREEFQQLLVPVTDFIGKRAPDRALEQDLNEKFPPQGEVVKAIETACHEAIADGWMCKYEAGGIRYGRVIKPASELQDFSVDVVQMNNIRGPHHKHPGGEIDLIMPIEGDAKFDGHTAGWKVFAADSAHYPTVTDGNALVLYLLPQGQIEFTAQ